MIVAPILILALWLRVSELTYYLLIVFILSVLISIGLTFTAIQIDPHTGNDTNDADIDPRVSMAQVFTGGLIGGFDPTDPAIENGAFWQEYSITILVVSMVLGLGSVFTGGPPDILKMPAGIAHRLWTGYENADPITPHRETKNSISICSIS